MSPGVARRAQLLGVDVRPERQDGHAPRHEAREAVSGPGSVELDDCHVTGRIVAHDLGARNRADGAEFAAEQQVASEEKDVLQAAVGREMVQR